MRYSLTPIHCRPWLLNGLSLKLIESHYENNYGGALRRLNAIADKLEALDFRTAPGFVVAGLKREELVALNSTLLHELYFASLAFGEGKPSAAFAEVLARDFRSYDRWRDEFVAMAQALSAGSGWVLLTYVPRDGRLVNQYASEHTQAVAGAIPILALDMYEHAYHMDFGSKAAAYVDAFMQNIRWDNIYRRYGGAIAADSLALGAEPLASAKSAPCMIDVRRAEDYEAGEDMIAGATWHDPARLADWSAELDASKPVLVYCMKGLDIGRSAALALRARGIDARYLVGGVNAWRTAGLPVQARASGPGSASHEHQ